MMRWVVAIAAAALAIAAGYLAFLNQEPLGVRFAPGRVLSTTVATALLSAFAAGAVLVGLAWGARGGARGWREWRLRRRARGEARRSAATGRARDLIWTGRYAQARTELLRGEAEPAADVARLQLLAETHLREGDPAAARALLTQGLARFGSDVHLLDLLADACEQVGDHAAAIEALEAARALAPESPRLLGRLRDLYTAAERWEPALAVQGEILLQVRDATRLRAEEHTLRGLRYQACLAETDARRAARKLKALAREDPTFLPAWVSAGDQLLRAGRKFAARRTWERGARERPAVALLERLEQLHDAAGKPERTERLYRRLQRRHPEAAALPFLLARLLIAGGHFERAASALEALPDSLASRPLAHALWGELYRRRGDAPLAAEAFARALGNGLGLGGPHRCTACRRGFPAWAGYCPGCRGWDTLRASGDLPAPR